MTGPDRDEVPQRRERLTLLQRRQLRRLKRRSRGSSEGPLSSEDWANFWSLMSGHGFHLWKSAMARLPTNPRCGVCGAPFAGIGRRFVAPLGYRPSRKNPHICATCVELTPPGGTTMAAGVLFVDLRGFTAHSEGTDPERTAALLRRFYASAERALFPDALIDKLIGDQVMALYIPMLLGRDVTGAMVDNARELLERMGYGTEDGPFAEAGVGIDYGPAFVGNLGEGSVYDFTAVGDVVNTASRLQAQAAGGEILYSARVADRLDQRSGERVELRLKGKSKPEVAYRIRVAQ